MCTLSIVLSRPVLGQFLPMTGWFDFGLYLLLSLALFATMAPRSKIIRKVDIDIDIFQIYRYRNIDIFQIYRYRKHIDIEPKYRYRYRSLRYRDPHIEYRYRYRTFGEYRYRDMPSSTQKK
jgi:hypothetical protein